MTAGNFNCAGFDLGRAPWQQMYKPQKSRTLNNNDPDSDYAEANQPVDHTHSLSLLLGWGAYDVWTRRRTVADLILLTYFDAFKSELLKHWHNDAD